MASVSLILVVIALILTILNGAGKHSPLWVPVLLLCIALLVSGAPLVIR